MELARLVGAVEQVRATTKKSEKIRILAETLRATRGREAVLTALYLSGSLPQGKIGIGWNLIQQAIGKGVLLSTPEWVGEKERSSSAPSGERLTLSDVSRSWRSSSATLALTSADFFQNCSSASSDRERSKASSSTRLLPPRNCLRPMSDRPLCSPLM